MSYYFVYESIPIRILRLKAAGLIDLFESRYVPYARKCLDDTSTGKEKSRRLSVAHFSSAFVILGAGCGLALLAFIVEHIRLMIYCHRPSRI